MYIICECQYHNVNYYSSVGLYHVARSYTFNWYLRIAYYHEISRSYHCSIIIYNNLFTMLISRSVEGRLTPTVLHGHTWGAVGLTLMILAIWGSAYL